METISTHTVVQGAVFRVIGLINGRITFRWFVAATTNAEAFRAMTTQHPGVDIPRTMVKQVRTIPADATLVIVR